MDSRRQSVWGREPNQATATAVEGVCRFVLGGDAARIVRFTPVCVPANVGLEGDAEGDAGEEDAGVPAAITLATQEHEGWNVFYKLASPEKLQFPTYRARLQAKMKVLGAKLSEDVASRRRPSEFRLAAQRRSEKRQGEHAQRVGQSLRKARVEAA